MMVIFYLTRLHNLIYTYGELEKLFYSILKRASIREIFIDALYF